MKNFELITFSTSDELARSVATDWLKEVAAAQRAGQLHHVALSGGRITQTFLTSVVELAQASGHSLQGVHFFWADERCVPATSADSNVKMAQELLFTPLKVPASQIHRIRGEDSPEAAAEKAEEEIRRVVLSQTEGKPALDLVFLGLGEDGHTASLFPGESSGVSASPAVYRAVFNSPKPPPERVTLGFSAIGAAKQIWMLASGKGKERALQDSLSSEGKTPFGRVLRMRRQTKIFTDIVLPS